MALGGRCLKLRERMLAYALRYPEAHEDHPWDETVVKVRKKVFVFFGHDDYTKCVAMTVKLPESAPYVLNEPFAEPTGYGLGKSGWVSLNFEKASDVSPDLLEDLIDESYRAVAPKRLVAGLDEARATGP